MKSGVHYPAVNGFPSKGMPILDEVWNNTFTKGSRSMQDGLGIKFPFVDDESTIVPTVDPEDIYIPMQKTRDGTDTILFRDIPAQNWGVSPTEMELEKDKVLKQLLSQQSPDDELKPRFAGDTLASIPEMLWELPGQVRDAFNELPGVIDRMRNYGENFKEQYEYLNPDRSLGYMSQNPNPGRFMDVGS